LRIDLVASVGRERRSHDRLVLAENVAIALAELSLQSRRALDVREEKRDGAGR
jgi:hypothetical protein